MIVPDADRLIGHPNAVYLNSEVDRLTEAEGVARERLWSLEDQITGLEVAAYQRPGRVRAHGGRGAGLP